MNKKKLLAAASLAAVLVVGQGGSVAHSTGQVEVSIATWSAAYHLDPAWISSVVWCESSNNPAAYNPSGASGVAQFMPATFLDLRDRLNQDTALAPGLDHYDPEQGSVWDANAAIHVLVWAHYRGYSGLWSCG